MPDSMINLTRYLGYIRALPEGARVIFYGVSEVSEVPKSSEVPELSECSTLLQLRTDLLPQRRSSRVSAPIWPHSKFNVCLNLVPFQHYP